MLKLVFHIVFCMIWCGMLGTFAGPQAILPAAAGYIVGVIAMTIAMRIMAK